MPPSTKFIETCRHRDTSDIKQVEQSGKDTQNKLITPKPSSKKSNNHNNNHMNIVLSSVENFSFKKKVFPSNLLSGNKRSNVQARVNNDEYAVLISSYEKKAENPKITNSGNKGQDVKKVLEFNTGKGSVFKENSFSLSKYSFKVEN